ncbi:hypothetical protein GGR54DRAFT_653292 [Hypoxylon sp. NC1633]|nr:hypothetical protein GGR54DRAFT_653292 [Hypoxylon sp. NC1633]
MYSPIPEYSIAKETRQHAAKDSLYLAPETGRPSRGTSPTALVNYKTNHSIVDFFEPAIEGPPSPERIRAFSNQMKRNSTADKHRSELTTSSGSSSRYSGTSDKPSWNQSMESLSLSRNPSQKSTSSGVPSRDRPESTQFFGKAIFNRRGKLRREGSDQSSNSSLEMFKMPTESAAKDQPFIQSVFARRRALRGETAASSHKKLQISGPYNFQHLSHTHKDSVPEIDRTNRMELMSEFSSMRPRRTTDASMRSIGLGESQSASFASESFSHQKDPSAGTNANGPESQQWSPVPPMSAPPRLAKRAQSQDKIRFFAPPRPPRSPTEGGCTSPIPPPPRTSSRVSMRHNRFDSLSMTLADRPATSIGFRKPQPFTPTSPNEQLPTSASRVSPVPAADSIQETIVETHAIAHATTRSDDAAWPLPNSISPLPDVPEEEEHHVLSRPSRMSITSNHSSLRGSVSVPLLRQLSLKQSPQRPPSNASDTLGRFDLINIQRAPRAGASDDDAPDEAARGTWEDDIDYCYEHEAEADCDYAWERPSCDIARGGEMQNPQIRGNQTETILTVGGLSPILLSPGSSVPALSPASQMSPATQHEAVTPTNPAVPVTSNFSLPRRDSSAQLLRVPTRPHSPECNFQESQGFSLSPSLLIPNDYHQQMLRHEREELLEDSDDDEDFLIQGPTLDDEPEPEPIMMRFGKPSQHARSSASTTDSALSEHSMASSRHKSTTSSTSTSTAYTRWTGSSTSSWQARDSSLHVLRKPSTDNMRVVVTSPLPSPSPALDVLASSPRLDRDNELQLPVAAAVVPQLDLAREKHARTQSHADLLMRSDYSAPPALAPAPAADHRLAREPLRTRRRARTTSRSHASPQFALFPVVSAMPGGRI